jgi:phage shock protein PspC (stress-responsive transcriptional regulator)
MTNAVPPTPSLDQPAWQPPPTRPQLRRSSTDSMIGGVSGGLAEYSGIDAVLWRVGFVGLTLAGGAGVVLYLLLWVLVPAGPARPDQALSPLEQLVQRLHAAINGTRATPPHA